MRNFLLKWLIFVLVLLALVLCSFERSTSGQAQQREVRVGHLLKSLTYNGEDQTLSWVMSERTVPSDGKFGPTIVRMYRINLQEATMTVDGRTREIDPYESVLVYRNIEVIAQYLLDSVGWWRDERLPGVGRGGIVPR